MALPVPAKYDKSGFTRTKYSYKTVANYKQLLNQTMDFFEEKYCILELEKDKIIDRRDKLMGSMDITRYQDVIKQIEYEQARIENILQNKDKILEHVESQTIDANAKFIMMSKMLEKVISDFYTFKD